MCGETEPCRKQSDDHIEDRIAVAENQHAKQRRADGTDGGVHRIPGRINPRNFVGQKLHGEEDTGDRDDPRVGQHLEAGVLRREVDPVEADGQTGEKDNEVKIQAGQGSQAHRHAEKLQDFHAEVGNLSTCGALVMRRPGKNKTLPAGAGRVLV